MLFGKKKISDIPIPEGEPVIRASICTGEKTGGVLDRETGEFHAILMIRDSRDLREFCELCHCEASKIRTIW